MFSVRQKNEISEAVQKILRATNHPELSSDEIGFNLHVEGAESWSWADIKNNGAVPQPEVNPWNERLEGQTRFGSQRRQPRDAGESEWLEDQDRAPETPRN